MNDNHIFSPSLLKKHQTFMRIALEFANLSHCVSHKVCTLFVRDSRIIVTGINGTPSGYDNCDSLFCATDYDRAHHHEFSEAHEIHGEMNGILFAAKHGISLQDCVIYITLEPCNNCMKNLIGLGIKTVYFNKSYDLRDDSWDKFRVENGVDVYKIEV
jgi:dCMP deaminase